MLFVAQIGFEVAAQRLILTFLHLQGALLPVRADLQRKGGRRCIKLVVQCIAERVTVDGQQRAAGPQTQPLGGGIFVHRRDV